MSKPIQTSQVSLRRLHIKINGTGATPVASGVDQYLIESVVDNGVGHYTINLNGKAKARNNNALDVIAINPIGAFAIFQVVATTSSSVTVKFADAAAVALDVDFAIEIQANDNRFLTSFC
jgi:hypothetical protein